MGTKKDKEDDDWFERERLHRAAADGDQEELRRLVAADGYALDAFDDLGRTPLHYALEGEHYRAAEWLIQQRANVNAHDEATIGETPLALAVQRDYPEMVELLLAHGADPDITGWMGNTARMRAQRRKDDDGKAIAALVQRYQPR
ncbi:MAG: ankyrin repeat domain-containing protein [Pseudomonadota bacterium]